MKIVSFSSEAAQKLFNRFYPLLCMCLRWKRAEVLPAAISTEKQDLPKETKALDAKKRADTKSIEVIKQSFDKLCAKESRGAQWCMAAQRLEKDIAGRVLDRYNQALAILSCR